MIFEDNGIQNLDEKYDLITAQIRQGLYQPIVNLNRY